MNRNQARKIAETITNQQIKEMLDKAKVEVKYWNTPSIVNKGCSKGTAWNILAKGFDVNANHHIMAKTNMVREFGEYLPDELKPAKKAKATNPKTHHQDPIF